MLDRDAREAISNIINEIPDERVRVSLAADLAECRSDSQLEEMAEFVAVERLRARLNVLRIDRPLSNYSELAIRDIRIQVLRDLLTFTDAGIELDSPALRELIQECEAATMPVGRAD